jgi:hypothetical protein
MTACTAVTRADVELALGRRVDTGVEEQSGSRSTCDYTSSFGQVTITIQKLDRAVDVKSVMSDLMEALPGTIARPAASIGIHAFFLDIDKAGTQLHVMRGERDHLLVSILGFGAPSEVSRAAAALAKTALDRL